MRVAVHLAVFGARMSISFIVKVKIQVVPSIMLTNESRIVLSTGGLIDVVFDLSTTNLVVK